MEEGRLLRAVRVAGRGVVSYPAGLLLWGRWGGEVASDAS